MYPQRELIRLAAHKIALRRRIGRHRAACAEAASRVARPLAWLDRALAFCRRLSPVALLAAVPLLFLLKRKASPPFKLISSLVNWGPLIFNAARSAGAAARMRFASTKP